jgi:hypothetical protein
LGELATGITGCVLAPDYLGLHIVERFLAVQSVGSPSFAGLMALAIGLAVVN